MHLRNIAAQFARPREAGAGGLLCGRARLKSAADRAEGDVFDKPTPYPL